MLKLFLCSLCLLIALPLFSQSQLARINDPDGYTNVRAGQSSKTEILFQIQEGEYFYVLPTSYTQWKNVTNMDGKSGYMHGSRIEIVKTFTVKGKTFQAADFELKQRRRQIGEVEIKLIQLKNPQEWNHQDPEDFICRAYLDFIVPGEDLREIVYRNMEPNGGAAGVAFLADQIPNHLAIVKHGDYEGESWLVSKSGKITHMSGGRLSSVQQGKYVINFAECDMGFCGLNIYDIQEEKKVFALVGPLEVYTFQGRLVLNLMSWDNEDDVDLKVIDWNTMSLKEFERSNKNFLNHFEDFIPYELSDSCLCY